MSILLKTLISSALIALAVVPVEAQLKPVAQEPPTVVIPKPIEERPVPQQESMEFEWEYLVDISQNEAIKAVILAQLAAFRDQDYSKAYYAYSASDFQHNVPLETFKIFVKKTPVLYRNHSFTLQNIAFSGVVAVAKGVLKGNDDNEQQAEYHLILENGNWKIRKMELFQPLTMGQVRP